MTLTVKQMKDFLNKFDESYDDFKLDITYCRELSEEELKGMLYPYPYQNIPVKFETDDYDIGYSDKELCIFLHDNN